MGKKRGYTNRRGAVKGRKGKLKGTFGVLALLCVLGIALFSQDEKLFREVLQELPEALEEARTEAARAEADERTPAPPLEASHMEVHFIDVGQGDASLIKCEDEAMLIDTGEASEEEALKGYLHNQGIEKLDYLVLTHPDSDHIGGAASLIEEFYIETVFMSDFEKDNQTYRSLIQTLDDKQLAWSTPEVGSSFMLGSARITVLAPNREYSDPNNASVALRVENGNNSFLFTGDAEEEAEEDILANGFSVQADVYKAGHHGSRTASGEGFVDAVSPSFAVISCGEDNSYGHPHAEPMNTFRARGMKVFRTDEQGSIIAFSDGSEITWNCAPSETWKAGEPVGSAG